MSTINLRIQNKHDMSSEWAKIDSTFAPLSGEIIVYDDCQIETLENGQIKNIPGIKIGDGTTLLKNLPFVSSLDPKFETALRNHINNQGIHVNLDDKNAWNNHINNNGIHVSPTDRYYWDQISLIKHFAFADHGKVTISIPSIPLAQQKISSEVSFSPNIKVSGKLNEKSNVTGDLIIRGEHSDESTFQVNSYRYTPLVSLQGGSVSLSSGKTQTKKVVTDVKNITNFLIGTYIESEHVLEFNIDSSADIIKNDITYKIEDPIVSYVEPTLNVKTTDFRVFFDDNVKANINATIESEGVNSFATTQKYLTDIEFTEKEITKTVYPIIEEE